MTLVMDGVRRTTGTVSPIVKPVRKAPVLPVGPAITGRIAMDGIRRTVPTPREILTTMGLPEETAAILVTPELPKAFPAQKVAFGLVATALLTAGVATSLITHPFARAAAPAAKAVTQAVSQAASQGAQAAGTPISAPAAAPIDTGLQTLLNNFAASQPGMFSIVVKNLSTGETATIDQDRVIESASIYKLFVADSVYHGFDIGTLTPGQAAGGGSGRSINDCLTVMINISDNTCGRALGTVIGWGDKNSTLAADGFTHTSLTGTYPQTSASDVATLFERLYSNTLNAPSSNDSFMKLLKDQRVNNRLPIGLPAGTIIAHKTGDLDGYMHDAGIVYGPKADYVVVVMSGSWNSPGNAPSQFANLSQQLWQHIEQ